MLLRPLLQTTLSRALLQDEFKDTANHCYHSVHFITHQSFAFLLKVAVNGTHQCDFLNFCGALAPTEAWRPEQASTFRPRGCHLRPRGWLPPSDLKVAREVVYKSRVAYLYEHINEWRCQTGVCSLELAWRPPHVALALHNVSSDWPLSEATQTTKYV